jgi:predicted nucleic-acid-binding protein
MRAVDTNILVRLMIRDDPRQVAAAEAFIEHGAWVSVLVLTEAAWVVATAYGLSPAEVSTTIDMLLYNKNLIQERAEVVRAALSLFRSRPALGFSDCMILELARSAGHLPLGTFDRDLSKIEGAVRL